VTLSRIHSIKIDLLKITDLWKRRRQKRYNSDKHQKYHNVKFSISDVADSFPSDH
jgi:hypothetical protein